MEDLSETYNYIWVADFHETNNAEFIRQTKGETKAAYGH